MLDAQPLLAAGAVLVLMGVLASKVSARLGVPALLLFLGIGMLAGSEGVGGIEFADYELAQSVGVVALAFILFSGGLDTDWRAVRPVLGRGVLLATVGVAGTAAVTGVVATWAFGFSLTTGLLLGAIVSSTDAAAVFSVLRSHRVSLRGQLRPLLELESGSNDPMAVFLTVGFLMLIDDPSASVLGLVLLFVQQMAVGGLLGYGLARLAVTALNRLHLEYDGLYPVLTLALVPLVYGTATLLGGSGFLAVYVAGLAMGHARFIELGLPRGALAVLITRGDGYVVPQGGTVLEPGDDVLVLAPHSVLDEVRSMLSGEAPPTPPGGSPDGGRPPGDEG